MRIEWVADISPMSSILAIQMVLSVTNLFEKKKRKLLFALNDLFFNYYAFYVSKVIRRGQEICIFFLKKKNTRCPTLWSFDSREKRYTRRYKGELTKRIPRFCFSWISFRFKRLATNGSCGVRDHVCVYTTKEVTRETLIWSWICSG